MTPEENLVSLDEKAAVYFTDKALGPDRKQVSYIREAVVPQCKGPKTLELGYGNGIWTRQLYEKGLDITVIEGSSKLAKKAEEDFAGSVRVVNSLFEDFITDESFDTVIASCVLEHVVDPMFFLGKLKSWAHAGSDVHITVPNAVSLHRRIGLKMGLLKNPLELSPQDIEIGHHTSYTLEIFRDQLESAGFEVNYIKGIFLKPVNSAWMMDWTDELLDAFNEMAEELPEYSGFFYANCGIK